MIPPVNIVIGAKSGAAIAAFTMLGNLAARLGERLFSLATSVPNQMRRMVESALTFGDALQKASLRTGIAEDRLAGLNLALKLGDSSMESLIAAARGFARGGRGDLFDALIKTAGEFEKIEDATIRNRIAIERFGRSVLELMPILSQGRATLERFAGAGQGILMLPEGFAERAATLRDTWTLIQARFQGFGIMIADKILPLLQLSADRLMDALMNPAVINSMQALANSIMSLVEQISRLINENLIQRATDKLGQWIQMLSFTMAGISGTQKELDNLFTGKPFWKRMLLGMSPIPLIAAARGFSKGLEEKFMRDLLSINLSSIESKQKIEPFNWRALLEASKPLRRGFGADFTSELTGVTSGRTVDRAGFLQRGFATPFEARAVATQINLQRESLWYLNQIASSLRELVPAVKETLG